MSGLWHSGASLKSDELTEGPLEPTPPGSVNLQYEGVCFISAGQDLAQGLAISTGPERPCGALGMNDAEERHRHSDFLELSVQQGSQGVTTNPKTCGNRVAEGLGSFRGGLPKDE